MGPENVLEMTDIRIIMNQAKWINIQQANNSFKNPDDIGELTQIVLTDIQVEKLRDWLNKNI